MKRVLIVLNIVLLLFVVPVRADNTITFEEFLQDLREDGVFDGNGATIRWEPDEFKTQIQRIQNSNAQYQISFDESVNSVDVVIKNANFEYVPADIDNHDDAWENFNKDFYSKDEIRNAEFQLLNSGNVTIENCNFEKVIVSPYGQNDGKNDESRVFTVKNSKFSNVYNAYALKDIYPHSAYIENNIFENCSGAIYFEGGIERGEIIIKNNTFNTIDKYALVDKVNTRGVIQFSPSNNISENTSFILEGNTISGNLVKTSKIDQNNLIVIRQLSNLENLMIKNWTLGEAISIKVEADDLKLPMMDSGKNEKGEYKFIGWLSEEHYNGPTDVTEADKALVAGESIAEKGKYYYAVWEFVEAEEPTDEPSAPVCAGDKDTNCDGVVTCEEEKGEGWTWNNTTKVCEFTGGKEYVVVNTAAK